MNRRPALHPGPRLPPFITLLTDFYSPFGIWSFIIPCVKLRDNRLPLEGCFSSSKPSAGLLISPFSPAPHDGGKRFGAWEGNLREAEGLP